MKSKNRILFLLIIALLFLKNNISFGYLNSSGNLSIYPHNHFYNTTSTYNLIHNHSFYNSRSNDLVDGITNPSSPFYQFWHPPRHIHPHNHAFNFGASNHLLHHNNHFMFPNMFNNSHLFAYERPTMFFSTPSGQYFDFSVKGLREYLDEKLANDNFAGYKEFDPYIRELEDKKANAQFSKVIFTIAGISMAILGFSRKETDEFGIETNEPNLGLILSGAGLITVGYLTYNSIIPKRKDLMKFINKHNIKYPNSLLKIGLNENKLAKNISTNSGRRQIKNRNRRIILHQLD